MADTVERLPFRIARPAPGTAAVDAADIDLHGKPLDEAVPDVENQPSADLEFADEQGNAIAQFSGGEFATKKFDSRTTPKTKNAVVDLELADEQGNAVVQFADGGLRTRDFDSSKTIKTKNAVADLEFVDERGNAIVQFIRGHIKTKEFDSENIEPTPSPTPSPSTGFNLIRIY